MLLLTAAAQAVVVVLSGSVALLGDTLHNVADALTAVPLGVAFLLGRRPADPPVHLRLRPGRGPRRDRHRRADRGVRRGRRVRVAVGRLPTREDVHLPLASPPPR